MKRFLIVLSAFLLCASLIVTSAGCSREDRSRDNEEDEEEASVSEGSDEDVRDTVPLEPDLLDGTWLTEDGFFCKFDMSEMVFTDRWGLEYRIVSVEDDCLYIELIPVEYTYFSPASVLPVYDTVELDIECYEDAINLLGYTCYRTDSQTGQEYVEDIRSRIAGHSFSIDTYMGGVIWSFNDDLSELTVTGLGVTETANVSYFDGAYIEYDNAEQGFFITFEGDDMIWGGGGSIVQITNNEIPVVSDWLMYDSANDEITVLEFDENAAKNPSAVPVILGYFGTQELKYEGQNYEAMYVCDGMYVNNADGIFMIDMRNPYAQELVRRSEYSDLPAGSLSSYEYDFIGGSIIFDKYENEWPSDVVDICRADEYYSHSVFPDYDTSMVISDWYQIEFVEDREAVISFEYDDSLSSDVSVYRIADDELEMIDTIVEDGAATASISEDGVYILSYDIVRYDEITEKNYFATDPHNSAWALSGDAGDIPDLVDMSYIESSYNSLFVIDSVEDLASFTYFVNTYPRDYDDDFIVWADVVDDIDLSGYEWAPIGTDDLQFFGIFCGNGHTISGLTIDNGGDRNGFFGSMYFSTVIGVNIEDASITGNRSHLMCFDTSTTDFIDCHVSGTLPDNFDTGVDLFPDYSDYGNNGYHYCSYSILNGAGDLYEASFNSNYPHPNMENDLENHFDPEGDGTFDYSEDYFFG